MSSEEKEHEAFFGEVQVVAPWNEDDDIEWDKVTEVSDGLYRTRLPAVGGSGFEWDDLVWFQERGLRITDFRLKEVKVEASEELVGLFQTTYCRLDDPAAQVTLPPRGMKVGKNCVWTLELSPNEHITSVWTYYQGTEDWLHRSEDRLAIDGYGAIGYLVLKTNFNHLVGNRLAIINIPPPGQEFTCEASDAFAVAGFWGSSGASSTKLGVYLKPVSPDKDPNRFRRAARGLLLAHARHEATLGRAVQVESGRKLGALPRAVVLQVVEKLKDEEAAEYSGKRKWRSPFNCLQTKDCTSMGLYYCYPFPLPELC